MQICFLGTASAEPTAEDGYTSFLIEAGSHLVLVDASGNAVQSLLRAGRDPLSLEILVLTHHHADHLGGYPSLLQSSSCLGRRQPLTVLCAEPCRSRVRGLHELRVKESDRLEATAAMLRVNGVTAEIEGDDLIVEGKPSVPGGGEVAVEGERLADPQLAHECEARRVHERVRPLVVHPQPRPRLILECIVDPLDTYVLERPQPFDPPECTSVAQAPPQGRPGLAQDGGRSRERLS